MRRILALLVALVVLPTAALAQSVNVTPRFRAPYSDKETMNTALDRFDSQAPRFKLGVATLDFASAAANTCSADLTIAVPGSLVTDACSVAVPNASVNAGSSFTCWVSAAGTVTVRHCNTSAGANDPASGSFRVIVEN